MGVAAGIEEGDSVVLRATLPPFDVAQGRVEPIHRAKGRAMNGAPEDAVITTVNVRAGLFGDS
jgi:hypothetical protein